MNPKSKHLAIPPHWVGYGGLCLLALLFFRAAYNLYAESHGGFPAISVAVSALRSDVNVLGNKIVANIRITNRDRKPVSLSVYLFIHRASDPTGPPIALQPTNDADIVLFDAAMHARGIPGWVPALPTTIDLDPGKSFPGGVLSFQLPGNDGWVGETSLIVRDHVTGTEVTFPVSGGYPP